MSKICCVGDADICPKSSSCSMVLRSACNHRHSRESSTVKEHLHTSSPRKSKRVSYVSKKDLNNGTSHLESSVESSLKQLALTSTGRAYSILKERFYNSFEFYESGNQKLLETSPLNLSCSKDLHFSQLSSSNNSSVFNNINQKECSSDYSSATESDMNSSESFNSTSNMSESRRLTRSCVSSMRTLSGSEDEGDIAVQRIVRPRRNRSDSYSSFNTSRNAVSEGEATSQYLSNNHASHFGRHHDINNHVNRFAGTSESSLTHTTESSHLDRSTVQYSLFDRFRWFLWRITYMEIIRNINFDIWVLSRLHNCGKHKAIFCFILPLLFILFWGLVQHSSVPLEELPQKLNSAISSVFVFLSSKFSSLYGYFIQKEEVVSDSKALDRSSITDSYRIVTFLQSLTGVFGAISGCLIRTEERASLSMETKYEAEEEAEESLYHEKEEEIKSLQPSREEMELLVTEIWNDKISSLKEFIKISVHGTETEKLKKEQKLQSEIKNLWLEYQSLSGTVGRLENDIKKQNEKSETTESVIAGVTSDYKSRIDHLNVRLKNCCDKQWSHEDFIVLLEKYLFSAFKSVVDGDSDPGSKYYFFNQWLSSKFFSHEKLMQEINAALRRQSSYSENAVNYDNVIKVIESTVVKHVDTIKRNLSDLNKFAYSSFSNDIFSEDKIKKIVKEAIMLYDADKTGQVDYALESGGGSVLGTRCSETYVEKYGKISFWGVPLWTSSNSPRTAIQPDVQPGRCWAFKGSQGFLVLELSATIYPTGFTLEHIPVSLSPSGSIDSAPKNFSVWGLESEKESSGKLLGEYWYDINGEPLQYFALSTPSEQPYSYVELQIHSNHGNMEYTCLYRFRVHGRRFI